MDYLTILSTRFLILFPTPNSLPSLPSSSPTTSPSRPHMDSPLSSPSTPKPSASLLPPTPISLPISSLIYNESNCAYHLISHVWNTTQHNGIEGKIDREILSEVKVLVFKEIDKVKMFTRALGVWFNQHSNRMGEGELEELAGKFGLGLESIDQDGDHGDGEEIGMEQNHNRNHNHNEESMVLV